MEDLRMEEDDRYIETMRLLVDQMKLNQEIDEDGVDDDVLERQLDINSRRNDFNIMDRDEIVYTDEKGKEFVQ